MPPLANSEVPRMIRDRDRSVLPVGPPAVASIVVKTGSAIALWGAAVIGFAAVRLTIAERALATIASFSMLAALPLTDEVGFALGVLFALIIWRRAKAAEPPATTPRPA